MSSFAQRLLRWFDDHGRHDLPWQRDATPYHVWLAEIMLQQTQVATVIPYYEQFIAAFPSLEALARADEDAVLHRWSGLGYYARARNLRRAAQILVAEHDGVFPADLAALQALPGVGRSTAGAILSSALGGRAAILDGNVKRVLARYHAVDGWPGKTAVASRLWELAERHTPGERVADYTQGIMDLGATLCTRSKPDCQRCPFSSDCQAHLKGRQADSPGRKPRKSLPTRQTLFVIACTPDREIFLERRPGVGIWGGLWCFPEAADEAGALQFCEQTLATRPAAVQRMQPLRHSFSHFHLKISPLLLILSRTPTLAAEGEGPRSWPAGALPNVGLAAPVKTIWQNAVAQIHDPNRHPNHDPNPPSRPPSQPRSQPPSIRPPGRPQVMSRTVMCRKYGKELPGLDAPPYPGPKGQELFENVSKQAWGEWQQHQTMLINEKHLSLVDPAARKYLQEEMAKFLAGEEYDQAEGYVPPES